jgi:hypothetical protein
MRPSTFPLLFTLCLLSLSPLTACGNDDANSESGVDGGRAGGSAPGAGGSGADDDPLVWTPKDSGQDDLPPIEVPPPGTTPTEPSGMCAKPREPLPAALLPRCAASTRDCIDACVDAADPDACREACIAADTTPPEPMYGLQCDSCIYLQLFACIDGAGCHDGVAEVFCCLAENCPEGSPEGCGEQRCSAELMAALTCGYYAKEECLTFTAELAGQCFPPTDDADGGV